MNEAIQVWQGKVAEHVVAQLKQRNFEACFIPDAGATREKILKLIPDEAVVYRVGSMTMHTLGIWEALEKRPGIQVINPFESGLSEAENIENRRQGLLADVLLCSSNAITLDGRLVNLDGSGNRVAGLMFGPRKVILAIGLNKLVSSLEDAFSRIRNFTAPANCIRVEAKTPCVKTGLCTDCRGVERRCNKWSIIEGSKYPGRINILLVGEHLGY